MQFIVKAPSASEAELAAAMAAALAVFEEAGVTPYQAASASFAQDGWDMAGFPEDDDSFDYAAGVAWKAAQAKAREACSTKVEFELVPTEAELAAMDDGEDDDDEDDNDDIDPELLRLYNESGHGPPA